MRKLFALWALRRARRSRPTSFVRGRVRPHSGTSAIDYVTNRVRVPFHVIRTNSPDDSTDQDEQWQPRFLSQGLREAFDRKGRERVHFSEPRCVRGFGRTQQVFVVRKFCEQSVRLAHLIVAFSGSATSSRVSEIEIIGTNRMNKNG